MIHCMMIINPLQLIPILHIKPHHLKQPITQHHRQSILKCLDETKPLTQIDGAETDCTIVFELDKLHVALDADGDEVTVVKGGLVNGLQGRDCLAVVGDSGVDVLHIVNVQEHHTPSTTSHCQQSQLLKPLLHSQPLHYLLFLLELVLLLYHR